MNDIKEDSRIGIVLNSRYRITERLASGGMGVVYRGERLELGRPVAIKFLHESYKQRRNFLKRFDREARAMSKLAHPYCVSVIDFGVEGAPYIVMDYVTGKTLKEYQKNHRLTINRVMRIADQLLAAIAHAHGQGIIHRDIKPDNIMLCEATGVGEHVRIFDFGLAKLHDSGAGESQNTSSVLVGTPNYMSPEQSRGDQLDSRTDLYSIGVVLFEMLTGKKPFFHEKAVNVLKMHIDAPPPTLFESDPEGYFSADLERVISKALAKYPGDRYQTAEEFSAALEATPEGGGESSMDPIPPVPAEKRGGDQPPPVPSSDQSSATVAVPERRRSRMWRGVFLGAALLVVFVVSFVVFRQLSPNLNSGVDLPDGEGDGDLATEPVPAPTQGENRAPADDTRRQPSTDSATEPKEAMAVVGESPVKTNVEPALSEPSSSGTDPSDDAVERGPDTETVKPTDAQIVAPEPVATAPSEVDEVGSQVESEALPTEPKTVDDARQLIKAGQFENAIALLKTLRQKSPNQPFIVFLLANAYFEKRWWGDAMDLYREAIRMNKSYRRRPAISRNLIEVLASNKSGKKAKQILLSDVGKPALPYLKQAAKSHEKPIIRKRAKALIKQLQ